jgi:hypothetical protein
LHQEIIMDNHSISGASARPISPLHPAPSLPDLRFHHANMTKSPTGNFRPGDTSERKAIGANFAAEPSSGGTTLLNEGEITQLKNDAHDISNDLRLSSTNWLDLQTRMENVAGRFKNLAVTARQNTPEGQLAREMGKDILKKWIDSCASMQVRSGKMGSCIEKRTQKQILQFACGCVRAFVQEPEQQAAILANIIKQARHFNASATDRKNDAQGAIVRYMEKHLNDYPVETLIALAGKITPRDIESFSTEPPAGHGAAAGRTRYVGRLDMNTIAGSSSAREFFHRLVLRGVSIYGALSPGNQLVNAGDKLYQKAINSLTGRPSGQQRMIDVLLTRAREHPDMTRGHMHDYFARILDTVCESELNINLPYYVEAFAAYRALPEDDQAEILPKRMQLAKS